MKIIQSKMEIPNKEFIHQTRGPSHKISHPRGKKHGGSLKEIIWYKTLDFYNKKFIHTEGYDDFLQRIQSRQNIGDF